MVAGEGNRVSIDNVIGGILTILLATIAAGLSVSLALMVWEDLKNTERRKK